MSPDVVELHYLFVDRPEGDPLLCNTLWAEADEQAIPLELKTALNGNGIRVARLGGKLSPEMVKLLTETKSQARRHHTHSGSLAKIQMTDVLPEWNLFRMEDGKPRGDELKDGQGYFYVTPTIVDSSLARLTIAPEIEFGERIHKRVPAPDLSGWTIKNDRESQSFPELKLDLEMASGDYILLGALLDKPGSIGRYFFTRQESGKGRQVVLLVRVLRPTRDELMDAGYGYDDFFLQPISDSPIAGRSTARATLAAHRTPSPRSRRQR